MEQPVFVIFQRSDSCIVYAPVWGVYTNEDEPFLNALS